MSQNKSWCPIPWNSVSTRLNGYYRLCSQAHADKTTMGIFRDKNGQILDATNNSLEEARNCDLIKEVRACMLKGERHQSCTRCNQEDDLGIPSRRQWAKTEIDQITLEKCQSNTSEDGTIDTSIFGIREADVRFGNFCNIKCRSCWPGESTAWYDDWYKLGKKKFHVNPDTVHLFEKDGKIMASNDGGFRWYENSDLFSVLANTSTIRKIHMSGGEPIFIKKHQEFLKMLIDSGNSHRIIIDYNSNITNIPDRILDMWSKFMEIRMGASIDGVGKVNDYIRHPSKWTSIEKNFKKISVLGNCRLWATTTVMAYNVLYLPEIFEWVFSMNNMDKTTDISTIINLHLLRNPVHINVQIFPTEVKCEIKHRLESWLVGDSIVALNDSLKTQITAIINGYINYMMETDLSDNMGDFIKFTQSLDNLRNERFAEMLPDLAVILAKHGHHI